MQLSVKGGNAFFCNQDRKDYDKNHLRGILLFALLIIVVFGLTYFSEFTGFTYFADENKVVFDINESWNLSDGFVRVSQNVSVFDSDIVVIENKIVVLLNSYNLSEGNVYVDLVINETVVDSEFFYYVPSGIVNETINETEILVVEEEVIVVSGEDEVLGVSSGIPPNQAVPILNSTQGTNRTDENLTVYNQSTSDNEGDLLKNIINWHRNIDSLMVLNIPFEGGSGNGSSDPTLDLSNDYALNNDVYVLNDVAWNSTGGYDGFGAYYFPGAIDSYLNVSNDSSMNFNLSQDSFAVEFRFNAAVDSDTGFLFTNGIPSGTNSGYYAFMRNTGAIRYVIANGSSSVIMTGDTTIDDGKWHHVVMSVNGSVFKAYVDGVVDKGATHTLTGLVGSSGDLHIGAADIGQPWNGSIDEFRIWNTSFTLQQAETLYQNRTDRIHSSIIAEGDVWNATLIVNDGTQDSALNWSNGLVVRAANTLPVSAVNLSSFSSMNYSDKNIFVNVTITDGDADSITANETKWYNGTGLIGSLTNQTSVDVGNLSANQNWTVGVRGFDGEDWGNWIYSDNLTLYPLFTLTQDRIPYVKDSNGVHTINLTTSLSVHCEYSNDSSTWTSMAITDGTAHSLWLNESDYGFYSYYIQCNDTENKFVNDTWSFAVVDDIPSNKKGYTKLNFTANESQSVYFNTQGGISGGTASVNLSLITRNNISGAYIKYMRGSAVTDRFESNAIGLPNGKTSEIILIADRNLVNNLSNSTMYVYHGTFSNYISRVGIYQFNISNLNWSFENETANVVGWSALDTTNFRSFRFGANTGTTGTSGGTTTIEVEGLVEEEEIFDEFECGARVSESFEKIVAGEMVTIPVYDPCIGVAYVELTTNKDLENVLVDFFRMDVEKSNQYRAFDLQMENLTEEDIENMDIIYYAERDWVSEDCLENFGLESIDNFYEGIYADEDDIYYYFYSEAIKELGVFFISVSGCESFGEVEIGVEDGFYEEEDIEEEYEPFEDVRELFPSVDEGSLIVFVLFIFGNLVMFYGGRGFVALTLGKKYYDLDLKELVVEDENINKLKNYIIFNIVRGSDMNQVKISLMKEGWDVNLVEDVVDRVSSLPKEKLHLFVYSKISEGINEGELIRMLVEKGWKEEEVRRSIDLFKRI